MQIIEFNHRIIFLKISHTITPNAHLRRLPGSVHRRSDLHVGLLLPLLPSVHGIQIVRAYQRRLPPLLLLQGLYMPQRVSRLRSDWLLQGQNGGPGGRQQHRLLHQGLQGQHWVRQVQLQPGDGRLHPQRRLPGTGWTADGRRQWRAWLSRWDFVLQVFYKVLKIKC